MSETMTDCPRLRRAIAGRDIRDTATYGPVLDAYRTELLPAILGRKYRRARVSQGPRSILADRKRLIVDFYRSLFDHFQVFRAGNGGRFDWYHFVMLGEPYRRSGLVEDAHRLTDDQPVGVWASEALSGWNPGGTTLVLVAEAGQLRRLDPAAFGFELLAIAPLMSWESES